MKEFLTTVCLFESFVLVGLGILLIIRYYKNYSYTRDVFLSVACISFSSIPFMLLSGNLLYILRILILGNCALSMFILSNIKSNDVKWLSNILKAFEFAIIPIALLKHYTNTTDFLYFIASIAFFSICNFYFNIKNASTKRYQVLIMIISILSIYFEQLILKQQTSFLHCVVFYSISILILGLVSFLAFRRLMKLYFLEKNLKFIDTSFFKKALFLV